MSSHSRSTHIIHILELMQMNMILWGGILLAHWKTLLCSRYLGHFFKCMNRNLKFVWMYRSQIQSHLWLTVAKQGYRHSRSRKLTWIKCISIIPQTNWLHLMIEGQLVFNCYPEITQCFPDTTVDSSAGRDGKLADLQFRILNNHPLAEVQLGSVEEVNGTQPQKIFFFVFKGTAGFGATAGISI